MIGEKKHSDKARPQENQKPKFPRKDPFISKWTRRILFATAVTAAPLAVQSDTAPRHSQGNIDHRSILLAVDEENQTPLPIPELEAKGKKYVVVINGDSFEERHKKNVNRALDALGTRGFQKKNTYVAGELEDEIEGINRYKANKEGVKQMFAGISKNLKPEDKVVVYVTGHGGKHSIVLEGTELPHSDFLEFMGPLKNNDNVYVFDHCYSGVLPGLLMDNGFAGTALAPDVKRKECACQGFNPYFWNAIKTGLDIDGDKKSSIAEIFSFVINIYNRSIKESFSGPTNGIFKKSVPGPDFGESFADRNRIDAVVEEQFNMLEKQLATADEETALKILKDFAILNAEINVDSLNTYLNAENSEIRQWVFYVLIGNADNLPKTHIDFVQKIFEKKEEYRPYDRFTAAVILAQNDKKEALDYIIDELDGGYSYGHDSLFVKMKENSIPILMEVLKNPGTYNNALQSLFILAKVEVDISPAIPELEKALKDSDRNARKFAAKALAHYYINKGEERKIKKLMEHGDVDVVWDSAEILALNYINKGERDKIGKLLKHEDGWVVCATGKVLLEYYKENIGTCLNPGVLCDPVTPTMFVECNGKQMDVENFFKNFLKQVDK